MDKYKPCPQCKVGKVMTDELRREYNGRAGNKLVCPDCIIEAIYRKALS